MTVNKARNADDFLAVGAVVVQWFLNVFSAVYCTKSPIHFRCCFASNFCKLVISTQFLKLMNFDAAVTVVILAFYASHSSIWYMYVSCLSLIPYITHSAYGYGVPNLQRCLEVQKVFHEEVFLQTINSICRNEEVSTTQRTRHTVSWFLLGCVCSAFEAFKTETMDAWQHSWIFECTHADWTFCYFFKLLCSLFTEISHFNLSLFGEPIKQNKHQNMLQ